MLASHTTMIETRFPLVEHAGGLDSLAFVSAHYEQDTLPEHLRST